MGPITTHQQIVEVIFRSVCLSVFTGEGGPTWPLLMMHWTSPYSNPVLPILRPAPCLTPCPSPIFPPRYVQTCSLWSTYGWEAEASHPTWMLSCCLYYQIPFIFEVHLLPLTSSSVTTSTGLFYMQILNWLTAIFKKFGYNEYRLQRKHFDEQESIPVGCVPTTCQP